MSTVSYLCFLHWFWCVYLVFPLFDFVFSFLVPFLEWCSVFYIGRKNVRDFAQFTRTSLWQLLFSFLLTPLQGFSCGLSFWETFLLFNRLLYTFAVSLKVDASLRLHKRTRASRVWKRPPLSVECSQSDRRWHLRNKKNKNRGILSADWWATHYEMMFIETKWKPLEIYIQWFKQTAPIVKRWWL